MDAVTSTRAALAELTANRSATPEAISAARDAHYRAWSSAIVDLTTVGDIKRRLAEAKSVSLAVRCVGGPQWLAISKQQARRLIRARKVTDAAVGRYDPQYLALKIGAV